MEINSEPIFIWTGYPATSKMKPNTMQKGSLLPNENTAIHPHLHVAEAR